MDIIIKVGWASYHLSKVSSSFVDELQRAKQVKHEYDINKYVVQNTDRDILEIAIIRPDEVVTPDKALAMQGALELKQTEQNK
jgi:hypothetical protein